MTVLQTCIRRYLFRGLADAGISSAGILLADALSLGQGRHLSLDGLGHLSGDVGRARGLDDGAVEGRAARGQVLEPLGVLSSCVCFVYV